MRHPGNSRFVTASIALLIVYAITLPARAQETPIEIRGGVQPDGNYKWTVRNNARSPIVAIEFPHYHADLFTTPPGWTQECTFLVNVGVDDKPGVCIARAGETPGIPRGRSADFFMRISRMGALNGSAIVKVTLADGSVIDVPNVAVPRPNTAGETYSSTIGLGAVFIVILAITAARRRRRRAATPATETSADAPHD